MKKFLSIVFAVAFLAGCQTTTGPGAGTQNATNPLLPVSATRAVEIFNVLCGGTLPSFKSITKQAKVYGTWRPIESGVILSNILDMSYKLFQDDEGPTCSFVFGTTDSETNVVKAFDTLGTRLGQTKRSSNKPIIIGHFKGSQQLQRAVIAVLYTNTASKEGGRTYYNMHMYVLPK